MLLSIVVPTFRRTAALTELLVSLREEVQTISEDTEVIVVDNCPDQSARSVVAEIAPWAIYVSEPQQGVALARNAGTQRARGSHVIFIDDDELPEANWLAGFRDAAVAGSKACFGPVYPTFETPPAQHLSLLAKRLFSRDLAVANGGDITHLRAYLGTGNSMFERESCLRGAATFDPRFNAGGEDVWFLRELTEDTGVRLQWCEGAAVRERVPATRVSDAYIRRRLFRNDQLRCIVEAGGRNWAATAFWMLVGAAQATAFGAGAIVARLFDEARSRTFAVRAASGLGKVLWWLPGRV